MNVGSVPASMRNASCPCGSGKRYKECHGQIARGDFRRDAARSRADDGLAAHRAGRLEEAERAYAAALASDPGDPVVEHNLALIRMQRGDVASALPVLERGARSRPDEPEFHANLGLAYAGLDRFDDAIAAHRRALALDPSRAGAWSNLGIALVQARRDDEALDAFRRALAIDPGHARARWHLATTRLARGELAGWDDADARLDLLEPGTAPGVEGVPRWNGDACDGMTILVDDEQGYGDTIQSIRHVTALAARGARAIVRVRDELAGLVATVPGVADVVPLHDTPRCDAWVPAMSLPALLRVSPHGDAAVAYLRADPARVAAVRARLSTAPATLRIGLAWSGNPGQVNDRRRRCPLAALAPLLERDGIAWYSLQHVDGEDQIGQVPAARSLHLLEERHDFDGKAALMTALDLVVSVCTSSAHLAGALGRPLWLMLAHVPDWRWGTAGATSAWYPTARLFRQRAPGDWTGVVDDVGAALDAKVRA
jgi:Flp pilus assembly protein TadD